jgi:hypothetical protein
MGVRCDQLDTTVMLQTDSVRLRFQPSVWELVIDGEMMVIPSSESNLPRSQGWFWTPEWQAGEREASRELERGEGFGPFGSVLEMKAHFEAWKREQDPTKPGS